MSGKCYIIWAPCLAWEAPVMGFAWEQTAGKAKYKCWRDSILDFYSKDDFGYTQLSAKRYPSLDHIANNGAYTWFNCGGDSGGIYGKLLELGVINEVDRSDYDVEVVGFQIPPHMLRDLW